MTKYHDLLLSRFYFHTQTFSLPQRKVAKSLHRLSMPSFAGIHALQSSLSLVLRLLDCEFFENSYVLIPLVQTSTATYITQCHSALQSFLKLALHICNAYLANKDLLNNQIMLNNVGFRLQGNTGDPKFPSRLSRLINEGIQRFRVENPAYVPVLHSIRILKKDLIQPMKNKYFSVGS